jgi:hypothetical protein
MSPPTIVAVASSSPTKRVTITDVATVCIGLG